MPVIFKFKELFSLGVGPKKGFSATKKAKSIVPDKKDAVYFIKHRSNKTIYIGATWNKKTKSGKKHTASVVKRLRKHVDKFLNKNPVNAKKTKNWTQYRKKYKNHSRQIQNWTFGIFWRNEMSNLSAPDFETALITEYIVKYGHAPECNNEYSPYLVKSCIKKAISSL